MFRTDDQPLPGCVTGRPVTQLDNPLRSWAIAKRAYSVGGARLTLQYECLNSRLLMFTESFVFKVPYQRWLEQPLPRLIQRKL